MLSKFNPYLGHTTASDKTVNRLKSNWISILIW